MKKKIFISIVLVVSLLIVLCNINEEFYYKILSKSGESYKLNSNGDFEGRSRIYKNGIKIFDGYFKNGKMDGWSFKYYDNGKLELKTFYKDGIINGHGYEYYSNGKLKTEKFSFKGKLYAEQIYYSEKGQPTGYWVRDHRDMPNDFLYINYNNSGTIKQVIGTLLSEAIAIREKDGFEILKQGNNHKNIDDLYITVANPPKLKSTFKILVNNKEYIFNNVKSNTLQLTKAFTKAGKYVVIGIGTLKDNDKLIKRDTISVTFRKSI